MGLPLRSWHPDDRSQSAAVPEVHGVYADDELIEALRGGEISAEHRDPAVALLAAWRADIEADCAVDGTADTGQGLPAT